MTDQLDFGSALAAQLGRGFHSAESDGAGRGFRWSAGDAVFFLRNSRRPFLDVELTAPPYAPRRPIRATINSVLVDSFMAADLHELRARLIAPPLDADVLECHISVGSPASPADLGYSRSRRPLGLMFYRAALAGEAAGLPREFCVGDAALEALGRGFFPPEAGLPSFLRWTGERAAFAAADGAELTICLENVEPTRARHVEVLDGGEVAAVARLPRRLGACELRVPLHGAKPWRAITLVCEPWTPGGGDGRRLGVLFRGARVSRPR
jgi:hypothetical protein